MSKDRLDTEAAFKSIMGIKAAPPPKPTENPPDNIVKPQEPPQEPTAPPKERLIQTSFYITKTQQRAIKLRAATSEKPEEKDSSAIVRAALDSYFKLP